MRQTVEQWINDRDLIRKGDRVLVAVSGGPDSMALLHLLKEWEQEWCLQIMAAHVNHGLRTDTALEDEKFVQTWCDQKEIPFFSTYVSVGKEIVENGGNVQEQARLLRYEYLADLMREQNINVLATGHHADDQIETILMKQTSGRAILGDPAMRVIRGFADGVLIRPFLGVTKENILGYCRKHNISFQMDESNLSDKYTRNRFRHYMLPLLKEEETRVHQHFQDYADWMIEEREYIQAQAEKEWTKRIVSQDEHSVTISIKGMETLPLPLQRRGIHLILRYLCMTHVPELSVVHINQFLYLLHQKHPSYSLDWPGNVTVTRSYETVTFAVSNKGRETKMLDPVKLHLPGQTVFGDTTFSAQYLQAENQCGGEKHSFICDMEDVTFPLIIRSRLPGDKIQPAGMKGSKKVNRIFIEEKIPRAQRINWPMVVDAVGKVLWVPLLKKSIWSRQGQRTSDAILISVKDGDDSVNKNNV
ncbi:tRNA lysidine(34) synthetase TilS [Salibacterium salarium]|uniref:tRNA(Ile)-lysidine synthase n=1 Tax=Salibacterium salarium TaxID=284579 RepID=A0A3R9WLI1_9BACI|nr:tRNA lysidine(34) synthetase TilS [Salibacterium salarium]RSL28958.1 tRNA lysidine(34) synthetase TilS [Salibacterium salarium]